MELVTSNKFGKQLVRIGKKEGNKIMVDILQKLELLSEFDGFMKGHTKTIKNHSPLKEIRHKNYRIFYIVEKNIIKVLSILEKDQNKFKDDEFKLIKKLL